MEEIKINVLELDSAITKFQALESKCVSADTAAPSTVGGGKSVNELEAISGVYKNLNAHFAALVQNTASFLENVKNSYVENDRKAANKMSGE